MKSHRLRDIKEYRKLSDLEKIAYILVNRCPELIPVLKKELRGKKD